MAPRASDAVDIGRRRVTPSAFSALGIPLLGGRLFTASDRSGSVAVAVISQSLATTQWPGQSALGKRFRVAADGPLLTVVGVVGDISQHWLVDVKRPSVYVPLEQDPPAGFISSSAR